MARKVPIRIIATLGEMAGGFPVAHKVYVAAVVEFGVFNLGSLLLAGTSAYAGWLDVSQPFTDAVANFVPAVHAATAFQEEHRAFLEQHDVLYWVPAIRNVLSIDFALFFLFQIFFILALSIDVIANPDKAFGNFKAACNKLGYPVGNVILRLVCLLVLLLLFYFGVAGMANPHLIGLSVSIIKYFVMIGLGSLLMFAALYLAIPLVILKIGLCTEHQHRSALD
jgi:hypothetical protein